MGKGYGGVSLVAFILVSTGCSLLFDYSAGATTEVGDAQCSDDVDNDVDGRVDCYDPDCAEAAPCQEICGDQLDNDRDGRVDCADDECLGLAGCAEVCDNREDDDGDGAIDCRDSDCQSVCRENDVVQCGDDVDNDGDGQTDASDPRCWAGLMTQEARCASVEGGQLVANLDSLEAARAQFYFTGGDPVTTHVPVLGGALELSSDKSMGALRVLTGGWDGTRVEMLLSGRARVLFANETDAGFGTPAATVRPFLSVEVGPTSLSVASASETVTTSESARAGWQLLRFEILGGQLTGSVSPFGDSGTGEATALPTLDVSASAQFPSAYFLIEGQGLVARLDMQIGRFDPCDTLVPSREQTGFEDHGLDVAAARIGTTVCALSIGCTPGLDVSSFASDDGRAFHRAALSLGPGSAVGLTTHAERFVGAIADPETGQIRIVESLDCVEWEVREASGLPELGTRYRPGTELCSASQSTPSLRSTVSYVLAFDGGGEVGQHELYWVVGDEGSRQLVRAISADGLEWQEEIEIVRDLDPSYGDMLGVTALGNDLVYTHLQGEGEERGIRLRTVSDDEEFLLPRVFFEPSQLPGTYDRDAPQSVAIIPGTGEPAALQLLIGARGREFSGTRRVSFGTGEVSFSSSPFRL